MPSTPVRGPFLARHRNLEVLAWGFLPGLLAGTQLAGLLFFLNPDLPFGPVELGRACIFFGALLGAVSVALHVPFTWGRPARARRVLPWAITGVLAIAAILDGIHASRYAFFLPPGINVRLIKAALWLGAGAFILFYTALLHSLHRRPWGVRSRVGMTILALASVYAIAERREAFRPRPEPAPLPSVVAPAARPALLVVGIEGATLDAILPLAKQGHLPFFARLLEEGAYARLASFGPTEPPAQWTTVATGKLPYKHGIAGARVYPAPFLRGGPLRVRPSHIGFEGWGRLLVETRLVRADMRRSAALWEILARLGVPTGVLGWPATDPVPQWLAYAFSDRYFAGEQHPDSAAPVELAERGLLFRLAPQDVDPQLSSALGEQVPYTVLAAVAQDLWRQSLSDFLWDQRAAVRARFLVLPGLGEVSRRFFGGYSYSQFEGAQGRRHQRAAQSLTAYYRQLDDFLARSWTRLGERPLLAVVSAYGFRAPSGLDRLWRTVTGRGVEGLRAGAPDGVLMLAGDGVQAGKLLDRAELVDVLPTLLYAMGFPIARDLDGAVLTGAFDSSFLARHPLSFVPSYETLAGPPPEPAVAALSPPG